MKKRVLFSISYLLLVGGFSLGAVGCNNEPTPNKPDVINPVEVKISGYNTNEVYSSTKVNLKSEVSPSEASQEVIWSSSDNNIATISETGEVNFIDKGNVTIKATSKVDEKIFKEISFNSKYIIDDSKMSEAFDYSTLKGNNPSFKTLSANTAQHTTLNGIKGQYYVFEAHVKVTNPSETNTWSRISLGHVSSSNENLFHGLMLSGGPNFTAKKTVIMDVENDSDVKWGLTTDRSQIWNQHGLSELNFDDVKLTTVRNGDDYYYLINDNLFYKESSETFTTFKDIDTLPAFHVADCDAEFSNISFKTTKEEISKYLEDNKDKVNQKLYASYEANVEINDYGKSIKFKNADEGGNNTINVKDNAAKSIGDAFYIPKDKEATLEFDLVIDKIGSVDGEPAIVVSFGQYDNNPAETRSVILGEKRSGFTGWNSNSNLPDGIGAPINNPTKTKEGETYHVIINKVLNEEKAFDLNFTFNGLENHAWNWYKGDYTGGSNIFISSRNLDATLANITLTIK